MSPQTAAGDRDSDDALKQPRPQSGRALDETAVFAPAAAQQTQALGVGAAVAHAAPAELPKAFGRYRIQSRLGFGGMGSVFLARDTQLDRDVALKVPRLANDETGTLVERFMREARAAATLSHPNICPIFDVGQFEGTHFIAMGYVEGRPLTAYIESGRQQPERQVAMVVRKVALALEEAHSRGIVHRDLKPANIMIDRRGEPIVMDFGLACRVDDPSTRLTQDGILVGTPTYMSPEQIDQHAPVGPAADIYSLGVVLYELLTLSCPFQGNVVSVIGQVLHAEPKSVAELRPDVSAALVDICRQAMAKDVAQRFASMRELAVALGNFIKQDNPSGATAAAGATVAAGLASPVTIANSLNKENRLEDLLSEPLPATMASEADISLVPLAVSRSRGRRHQAWIFAGAALAAVVVLGALLAMVMSGSSGQNGVAASKAATPDTPVSPPPARVPSLASSQIEQLEPEIEPAPAPTAPPISPVSPESTAVPVNPAPAPPTQAPAETPPPPASPVVPVPAPATTAPATTTPPTEPVAPPSPGLGFPPGQQPPAANDAETTLSKEALAQKFHDTDRNGDGKLDPTESPMHIIKRADKNYDQKLTLLEVERAYNRLGSKLFAEPSADEMRKLPRPPEQRPSGRPGPPHSGRPGPPPRP